MESSRSAALEIAPPANLAAEKFPAITSDNSIVWGSSPDAYAKFHSEYAASATLRNFLGEAAGKSANPITLIYDNTIQNAEVRFSDVNTTINIPNNPNPFWLANDNQHLRQATEKISERYTTAQESAKYLAEQGVNIYNDLGVQPHQLSHLPIEKIDPLITEKIQSTAFDLLKKESRSSQMVQHMQQVLMDPQARKTYHEEWQRAERKEKLPENKAFVPYPTSSRVYAPLDDTLPKSVPVRMQALLNSALPGETSALEIGGAKRDKSLVTESLKYIGPHAEEHAEVVRNFLEYAASLGDTHTTNLIEQLHAHGCVLPNPPKNSEGRLDGSRFQEMLREQLNALDKTNEQESGISGTPVSARGGNSIPQNSELIDLDNPHKRNEQLKKVVTDAGISYNHISQENKTDYFNKAKTRIFTETKDKIAFSPECGKEEMDAAMQIAKKKWGNKIKLHGSDEYLQKAYASATKNGLEISNEADICRQLKITPPSKSLAPPPPSLTRS